MGQDITVGSLFSGAGLGDLGLTWAGFSHAWFCELDSYARKVLALRWPGAPIHEDARRLTGDAVANVDVLVGGFPCQPFSSAARGRNLYEKDRKAELVRLAAELRPQWVVGENVKRRPVDAVAWDLQALGYGAHVFNLGSSQIGADHQRSRWWVCAYSDNKSKLHVPIDAEVARMQEIRRSVRSWEDYARAIRVSDGGPHRLDRLRCLGNGQDPFATFMIGKAIKEFQMNKRKTQAD